MEALQQRSGGLEQISHLIRFPSPTEFDSRTCSRLSMLIFISAKRRSASVTTYKSVLSFPWSFQRRGFQPAVSRLVRSGQWDRVLGLFIYAGF